MKCSIIFWDWYYYRIYRTYAEPPDLVGANGRLLRITIVNAPTDGV
ncbi:MAG: hypothetical protein F6K39_28160 [Okeania sp. SIO3B3]|nr:hypothetical protein [Okeania sp. SIO3B3]